MPSRVPTNRSSSSQSCAVWSFSLAIGLAIACVAESAPAFDNFDLIEGQTLIKLAQEPPATPRQQLAIADLASLPRVLPDSRATLLLAKTAEGNLARLLVSPGLRKSQSADGPPLKVLLVERFDTFELPGAQKRLATGRDLVLFDGFRLDLDLGQVVPENQGEDLVFKADEKQGALVTSRTAQFLVFNERPMVDRAITNPSRRQAVAPLDFAGRYSFSANGQWNGMLELAPADDGTVSGRFRSDDSGNSYRVVGQIGKAAKNQIELTIQFPRSEMSVSGWLWTEGKNAISGTTSFLNRTYGFVAVRSGRSIQASGQEVAIDVPQATNNRLTVTIAADGSWTSDGAPLDDQRLRERMMDLLQNQESVDVRIQADITTRFQDIMRLIHVAKESGPVNIELYAPAKSDPPETNRPADPPKESSK